MGSAVKAVSRRVAEDGYAALAQTVGELAGGGVKPFDTYLPLGNKKKSLCIEKSSENELFDCKFTYTFISAQLHG